MRIVISLMLVLLGSCICFAGTPKKAIPQKACIHTEKGDLTMYGNKVGFDKLFSKMDSLIENNTGRVNIAHLGGSHVEAGVMTEQLRCNLMLMSDSTSYQNAGLGMTFPYTVAKLNTPLGYTSKREGTWTNIKNTKAVPEGKTLGLTGLAVSTNEPGAYAGIVGRQRMGYSNPPRTWFNHVTLTGYMSNDNIYPVIVAKDSTFVSDAIASGDSLSRKDSIWTFTLPFETDSIIIKSNGKPGTLTITGAYCTNDDPGFVVSPIGVNGASLVSYLRCNDLERDLRILSPDMVILGIGINDASGTSFKEDLFFDRYSTLIDMIRRVNPDCALIFITNNDSCRRVKKTYVNNPNGALVKKQMHSLAKKYDGAVFDLFDVMGGLKSVFTWEKEGLCKKDKIHFTNEGYTILGDMLYNAIAKEYDQWKEEGGQK